jgi:hypothetical protein
MVTWSGRGTLVLALVACGSEKPEKSARPERAPEGGESKDEPCTRLPFADSVPVAEASGAAAMTVDGRGVVLVVGDSGTRGAYVLVDATTGELVESGALPLGTGAGDDLEGLDGDGDTVWAVTSAGWMRRWKRVAGGFELADGPYAVGSGAMSCDADGVNCGKNYEALCVGAAGGCAGWLGSKAGGDLWCLVEEDGRLVADPARSIDVTGPEALTGCDVDPATGALWVGTNAFDGHVYRVVGAEVARVQPFGEGFLETLVVLPEPEGGVILHRYSDLMGAPSPSDRWRCR